MILTKTFRYRLEPTEAQRQLFTRFAGSCRFVFNHGLSVRQARYKADGTTLSYADQSRSLTEMKRVKKTSWLKEINAQVLQQSLKDLDAAYQSFFRRVKGGGKPGYPMFKKRGQQDAFRYPQDVKANNNKVYLPKIGWVAYRNSRPIEGKILQTTVKREGEHWFVSLACEVTLVDPKPVSVTRERAIGIDVGLKTFAVLSDGTEIANPRFLKAVLVKLKKAQQAMSRKTKRSDRWQKQVAKVAKLHVKVKNARKDFAHKASTAIVKNHDVIAVEDLNISGLVRNRCLSRAISDASWGMFLSMLEYKASWTGKHFVRIGRFEPSSKMCSGCGQQQPMPLSVRTYACGGCGLVLDRDLNASLNIRSAGLAVLNARGGA